MNTLLAGFLYGMFGGGIGELVVVYNLRTQPQEKRPEWLHSPFYWVITGLMILAGGGVVVVYLNSGMAVSPIVAVNVGASAPLLINTFATQLPQTPGKTN